VDVVARVVKLAIIGEVSRSSCSAIRIPGLAASGSATAIKGAKISACPNPEVVLFKSSAQNSPPPTRPMLIVESGIITIHPRFAPNGIPPEASVGFLALVSIAIKAIFHLVLKISSTFIQFKAIKSDFN
jgi:hypothetical protein